MFFFLVKSVSLSQQRTVSSDYIIYNEFMKEDNMSN